MKFGSIFGKSKKGLRDVVLFPTGGSHPRALSPRRWGKQKGRTLLEMLGVLAIIGVLSITALVGFTYAMNKHRANETIYDVMLRGTNVPMIDEYYYDKASGYEFRFPGLVNNGRQGTYYPMTTKKDAGSSYYVEATGVTYRVCELILKMNPTDIDQIVVGNTVYQGDSDICGNADGLAMKFCFGEDGTICDGTGHGGSSGGSGSGGSSGSTSGGSGSGSGSGEIGTTCDPACGTCEQCVDGSCEVRPCSISSCPDTQQPTGTDECGCIIGCEDKCPNLTCGTCEVLNYETCTCDVDPSCTCEERGGETIYYLTGTCCEQPSSCCSVDEGCVQEECTITDSTQCGVFCTEGAQTTSVCCTAVSIDGDDPMNHVWVGDPYGEGYCCASKSESQACCEAAGETWNNGVCSILTCNDGEVVRTITINGVSEEICCKTYQNAYNVEGTVRCCNDEPTTTSGNLCCTGLGEKAYAYYPQYYVSPVTFKVNKGSVSYGCCTNDPENSFKINDGYYEGVLVAEEQVCCSSEKPYFSREYNQYYACFTCAEPSLISYVVNDETGQVTDESYACCETLGDWKSEQLGLTTGFSRSCL